MVETQTIVLSTRGNADIQDITGRLAKAVAESGMANGTVTVGAHRDAPLRKAFVSRGRMTASRPVRKILRRRM